MRRLFIIGAGGLGREVLAWLEHTPAWGTSWVFSGFLDDNPAAFDRYAMDTRVVGSPSKVETGDDFLFVCAIGDPRTRLRICREMKGRGARFLTVMHPTAVFGARCTIGEGCIICPGVVVTSDVVLGDFVILNAHSSVGHDARIGAGTTLSGHVDITGFVQLGEGVFAGSHASVLPGAKVGDFARIGAGSVVLRSAKAGTTVMGVPAKQIMP